MTSPPRTGTTPLSLREAAGTMLRLLASLKLAVALIVVLVVVLAGATVLESWNGRDFALWHVYHSSWFMLLWAAVAANMLAAVVVGFPWGWRRVGFLATHIGAAVLALGAIVTFHWGIDGHVIFQEGATANMLSLGDRCQFTATWQGRQGVHGELPIAFTFEPGPFDWPEGKSLEIGHLADVGVKVLKFYRHARAEESRVAASDGSGSPAVRLGLAGPGGQVIRHEWLSGDSPAGELRVGPIRFAIYEAASPAIVEDFLKPPPADTDKDGVLSVHYEGQMERIGVSANLGKKVPIGKTKAAVEITGYFPNAKLGAPGKFESQGTEPRNPVLDLQVYLPGSEKPVRQFALARAPFFNLDRMHGRAFPVKFYYHHPAIVPEPGIEFLQAPDGKLYCRVIREGKIEPRGAVKNGELIEVAPQFGVSIVEHLPKARRQVDFVPARLGPGESGGPEPAALVEITAADKTEQFWMQRMESMDPPFGSSQFGSRTIQTSQGPLRVDFTPERISLGFSLRLLKFIHGLNPGRMGDASFASQVRLTDRARGVDEERKISMNDPLEYGKFTFYQSSYQEVGDGKYVSVLTAASDPGRAMKYGGSLLICLGILVTICTSSFAPRSAASGT